MRNPLTIAIETRIGVVVLLAWAVMFVTVVFRAQQEFSDFLTALDLGAPRVKSIRRLERERLEDWLRANALDAEGEARDATDAPDRVFSDEKSPDVLERYERLVEKFPSRPWRKR